MVPIWRLAFILVWVPICVPRLIHIRFILCLYVELRRGSVQLGPHIDQYASTFWIRIWIFTCILKLTYVRITVWIHVCISTDVHAHVICVSATCGHVCKNVRLCMCMLQRFYIYINGHGKLLFDAWGGGVQLCPRLKL